ncbi:SRPBCC family protein [Arsenicicoccus sp. oral taxon 190]|uniref:SRPBCC family protein n=1 Tax=Arsenicicoccus sp. oral taxon 190 TaxID=1658671 RepID=UPI00067A2DF9|nr:SRPBCC family protein [Arsenicicoccus sp. oral taxon 190]AKT50668.1 hypothetical protein ADJ73_03935 [Arsenicicoccus sp. oral taxon 190]
MTTYESTTTIDVPAAELFAYLSDVDNLPTYFPRVTSAKRTEGDKVTVTARIEHDGEQRDVEGEAWIKVEQADKTLTWGSQGPNNYTGQVDLDPIDDSSCSATVRISTDRQGDRIQDGVDEAVAGIKEAAEKAHA